MSQNKFTWLPFFKELLNSICKNSNPNSLYKEFKKFFPNNYNDINQLDPLTYICSICGGSNVARTRAKIAKKSFNLKSDVISDITGIPNFVNANYKFFHEYYKNGKNMTPIMENLWKFANDVNKGIIDESLFNKLLTYNAIKLAKLSQFIYICNPDKYFSCDTTMLSYLGNPSIEQNYSSFLKIQNICKEKKEPPYQLSEKAWYSLKSNNNLNQQKSRKFWLYAAGEKSYKWNDFYKESIMALGWDNLGNLKNYHSQDEIAQELQKYSSKDSYPKNDSKANWEFANKMDIGDIVYVKQGLEPILLGRGIIESDYIYDNTRNEYKSIRKVRWTHNGIYNVDFNELDIKQWNQKTLTDISENKYKDFCKKIEKIFNNNAKEDKNMNSQPLNQILYGPPGTGKTYNTVIKAMEIINDKKYDSVDYEQYKDLKKQFDNLKQQGQIEFVTFHQSYSYEEFVEGIKPYIPEWGNVEENNRFIGQDGIFKRIAKDALYSSLTLNNNNNNDSEFFYRIIEKFKEEYPIGSILQTQENNNFEIVSYTETSIRIQPVTEKRSKLSISYQPLEEMYLLNKKNKISTRKELEIAMNDRYKGLSSYYLPILKIIEDFKLDDKNIKQGKEFKEKLIKEFYQNKMVLKKNNELRYVLVIDEINRGDVSKIFGELITLIEEDKRIGENHQMTVTLPYSRETFGVPYNLYIIGTMNTADRSIALLDTALRRRFDFEEMMPTPELLSENVEGVDLAQLLTQINDRIKKDYDKDHQIGHSYLMGVKNKEQLERAYKNRILPLLNEYFYNDIDTVAKILNCNSKEVNLIENWFDVLKEAQKPTKKDNEQ